MACACRDDGHPLFLLLCRCLLFFLFCLLSINGVRQGRCESAPNISYTYSSFNISDANTLALLKDAGITKGALQLTPDSRNDANSFLVNKSGSVLLQNPFTLWQPLDQNPTSNNNSRSNHTNQRARVASFNTVFSINVFRYSNQTAGEGLTFLIAPSLDGPPPGSEGGFLGLTNATLDANLSGLGHTQLSFNHFVAIEFDTVKQEYDPDANHVGLDIGSVVSNKSASLTPFNITIAPEEPANYTIWIEYDGVSRHIWVYMAGKGKPKPTSAVLDAPLDLSNHVPEKSYLGFSASTGPNFELNCILEWNLTVERLPEESNNKGWMAPVIAVVGALVAAVVVGGIVAFFIIRRSRERRWLAGRQQRLEQTMSNLPGVLREFKYEKLKKATNNFDERLRLGKGGYGMVYKGMLHAEDGREAIQVAVKKFIRDEAKCFDDFIMEVDIINRLRHKNIVPLVGWCYKKGELLLVYEYMPNGSLDQHLFRRGVHEQRPVLSWESRYNIVADIASGLHYVHHEYERMVLHRDIKPSNVMLDAAFRARLGDFGLARVIEFDKNSFTDLGVAGTRGYIAPEYSVGHKATRQTDVFAFGALVLEIVTGKYALLGDLNCPLLSDWAWRLHGREMLLEAMDPNLGAGEFDKDEATRLLLLGLACSHPNPGDRPTMPQVLQIVSKSVPPPDVPPFKPAFVWPPEGGTAFELSDLAITSSSSAGSHRETTGNATSTRATKDTSYSSFQLITIDGSDTTSNLSVPSSGR